MSNDERVRIALEVATKAAEKALESFDAKTKESNATFTVFSGNLLSTFASRAIDSFTSSLSAGFSRAIQEARNTEREINSLNTALAANGLYSEEVSKQFQAFGDSIQATTMYAAGAVHENVALLASMTSLNNEGLQRTMSAATELAATFNLDLNTASQMLGNAFNGNVKSLAKLGLEIDKTKSTAENFDAILVQLEARQGTAASKTNTFEGSQKKLTDSTNSVFVALGNLLTQNPAVISALSKMAEVLATAANHLTSFAEYANANSGIFEILAAGAVTTGVAIAAVGTKALLASTALAGLTTAATAAWTAITGPRSE
ncbi:MAG: hypothetical protein RBT63_04775, partial [Bdellovibrionales bacterium]|nr:hypothetical protein [Bdellovibrionales bacterium]